MLYSLPETFVSKTGPEPPARSRPRRDEADERIGIFGNASPKRRTFRWRKGSRQWRIAGVGPASSLSRRRCGNEDGAEIRVSIHRSKVAWSMTMISTARGETKISGKRPVLTRKPAPSIPAPLLTTRSNHDCIFSLDHVDSRRPPKPPALSRVPLAAGLADRAADLGLRRAVEQGAATNRRRRLAGRIERRRRRDRSEA